MDTVLTLLNQEYLIEVITGLTICVALYLIYVLIKEGIQSYKTPRFNLEKEIQAHREKQDNHTHNGIRLKDILEAPSYDICKDPLYIKALEQNEALENIISRLKKHLSLQDVIIKRIQERRGNMELHQAYKKQKKR